MNQKNKPITELVLGHSYGTNAKKIYLQCCDAFGWDKSQAECFTRGQRMYAPEDCDGKGNSVWFICYSNLANNAIVRDKHVRNFVENNGNRITEDLAKIKDNHAKETGRDSRIVFVKFLGEYRFWGVFKTVTDEQFMRVHEKISDTYSL